MTTPPGRGAPAGRGVLHLDVDARRQHVRSPADLAAARESALQTWKQERASAAPGPFEDLEGARSAERERAALDRWRERAELERPARPTVLVAHRTPWLRTLLETDLDERGLAVVGSTGAAEDAVALAVLHQPDVLVVSDRLSAASGLAVAKRLATLSPDTLVVAQVEADGNVRAAREVGAHAVLSRSARVQDLVDVAALLAPLSTLPVQRVQS